MTLSTDAGQDASASHVLAQVIGGAKIG